MKLHNLTLAPLALAALTSAAQADTHTYTFGLDGSQESPPVATPATGTATVVVDDVTGAFTLRGTYSGLKAAVSAAHIHRGAVGVNGAVLVGLTVSGGTSGTISGSGTLGSSALNAMLAGNTYVNVHTGAHPGGEIRGQIVCDANVMGTSVTRNGTGVNFLGFASASSPIIGTSWNATVDTSNHPSAVATIVAVALGGPVQAPSGFGEVLGLPPYSLDVAAGTHALPIPDDCGLVGLTAVTQAATFALGGDVQLQNAIDVTFGTN